MSQKFVGKQKYTVKLLFPSAYSQTLLTLNYLIQQMHIFLKKKRYLSYPGKLPSKL